MLLMEKLSVAREHTQDEAIRELMAMLQRMRVEGAVDSEGDAIRRLIEQISKGELTPNEALERGRALAGSRQNYH